MFKKGLVLSTMAFVSLLNADYILEYQSSDAIQKFMYHSEGKAKLVNDSSDSSSSIYKIGKKTYIVTGGKIVDVDEMRAMAASFGYNPAEHIENNIPSFKIEKTSKRVKIAGVLGQVWIVSGSQDGEAFKEEVVVTNDSDIVTAIRSMSKLFTSMLGSEASSDEFKLELEKGWVIIKAADMQLKSFKEIRVNAEEYQLPTTAKKQHIPTSQEINETITKASQNYEKEEAKRKKNQDNDDEASQEKINIDKAANLLKSFF